MIYGCRTGKGKRGSSRTRRVRKKRILKKKSIKIYKICPIHSVSKHKTHPGGQRTMTIVQPTPITNPFPLAFHPSPVCPPPPPLLEKQCKFPTGSSTSNPILGRVELRDCRNRGKAIVRELCQLLAVLGINIYEPVHVCNDEFLFAAVWALLPLWS